MLKLLACLVICPCLFGQTTTITGPLYDASGALANCTLRVTPLRPNTLATAIISYVVVAGDLTGATGGYGESPTKITRHDPLALYPGRYAVPAGCSISFGSGTWIWQVPPGGSFPIQQLIVAKGRTFSQMPSSYSNTAGSFSQQ